jgi:hypothetical protein
MFLRRLGQNRRQQCVHGQHCAQFLEMKDGSIAVVGENITEVAVKAMPPGPGVGPKEGVVKVPRAVFAAACLDFPAS